MSNVQNPKWLRKQQEKKGRKEMCKIMAFAGLKKEAVPGIWDFAAVAAKHLSATNDKDGFGYAAATPTGALFGERWLHNADAFDKRSDMSPEEAARIESFQGALHRTVDYNSFGDTDPDNVGALILHARFATCGKGIYNTHPFVANNTALIHNGVISNAGRLKQLTSTCDSEVILNSYLDAKVGDAPEGIQFVADELYGTYACAVLGTDAEGVAYMDIFKNSRTALVCARVMELGCIVYCTTLDILEKTCAELKYTIEWHYWINSGFLIRMNVATGDIMSVTEFDEETDNGWGTGGAGSQVNPKHAQALALARGLPATITSEVDDAFSDEDIRRLYDKNGRVGA